jgi:CRISPR-associated endonuclease/helicase Cas3
MIDVGVVVRRYLDRCASPALLGLLATPFEGDVARARSFVPLLAATHDVGKISPGFQYKRPDLIEPLRMSGHPFSPITDETDHGEVTFWTLRDYLPRVAGWSTRAAARVARVAASHHGEFGLFGESRAA